MPQTPAEFILSFAIILLAGYVRGYGGFGFSMITVVGLTLLFPPAVVVPVVLLLEVLASAFLIAGVWHKINWPALLWLSIGVLAGTPAGVWLLGFLPEHLLKICIAIIIGVLAMLMRMGFRIERKIGKGGTLATGVASGVINGSSALGGPPVVLFFFSSAGGADASRASLIAFFLGTDIIAAGVCAVAGLLSVQTLRICLVFLLPMGIGLATGKRSFMQADQTDFRKKVMLYLILLAGLLLVKTVWDMYQV
jgi:uncharacterized membrane protein YfcA